MNNVNIIGRLTATPEIKTTNSGKEVTSFSLAVDKFVNKEKQVDFIDFVAWGNTAVNIAKFFEKGSLIAVSGSLQTRNYEDRNGNKRKSTEVLVNKFDFCGSNNKSDNNTECGNTNNCFEMVNCDDELPF